MRLSKSLAILGLLAAFLAVSATSNAGTFGSGANTFTIDFVTIGNAGNANDSGAGGGSYSSPYGGVEYNYRMGALEISQDMIDKATNLGMTNVTGGSWSADRPAADLEWYEAAAFVNWLNTSEGYQAAYDLTWTGSAWSMSLWSTENRATTGVGSGTNAYRHKDAVYFLPSEDEWYKAAFHKNDGVTANYWDYATASNSAPDGIDFDGDTSYQAVYNDGYNQGMPNTTTNVGLPSSYGIYGGAGNVFEWIESANDGTNDSPTERRNLRGSYWGFEVDKLRSSYRNDNLPTYAAGTVGLRVASVIPEPTSALLVLTGLGLMAARRRR